VKKILLTLPEKLVDEIDAMAKHHNRTRTKMIHVLLEGQVGLKYDLLPRIYPHEEQILKTWIKHLNHVGTMHRVTDHKDLHGKSYKTLWMVER